MTTNHPHDYLPATGHGALLPAYDLIARMLGFGRVYARLIAQADLVDGQKVLEIGCGTGNVIIRAKRSQPGIVAVGCDPDPQILGRARRKAKGLTGVRFDHAYAQQLPYADGEFDQTLSSMMLHHLGEDAKPAAAAEIFRVLRPGGVLHLVDIGGDMNTRPGLLARRMRNNPHAAGNLGDAIPRLFGAAGFDCTLVSSQQHRVLGQLVYYRATRPG